MTYIKRVCLILLLTIIYPFAAFWSWISNYPPFYYAPPFSDTYVKYIWEGETS